VGLWFRFLRGRLGGRGLSKLDTCRTVGQDKHIGDGGAGRTDIRGGIQFMHLADALDPEQPSKVIH
jgi:hypothetical protein